MSSPEYREAMRSAMFVAWVDHGIEGWSPTAFDSEADLLRWVEEGENYGSFFFVTGRPRRLNVALTNKEQP